MQCSISTVALLSRVGVCVCVCVYMYIYIYIYPRTTNGYLKVCNEFFCTLVWSHLPLLAPYRLCKADITMLPLQTHPNIRISYKIITLFNSRYLQMLCNYKQCREKNVKEGRKLIQPVAASNFTMTCSKSVNKLTADVIECFYENFGYLSPVSDVW